MKKPRLSGSLNYSSNRSDTTANRDLSGSMTFAGGLGALTPGFYYSENRFQGRRPDGVMVDQNGRRIGVSINGQVFLDDDGQNALRAGLSREQMAFGPMERDNTTYSVGADIGRFGIDLSKDDEDIFGEASYLFPDDSRLSVQGSRSGDLGFNYVKKFQDGGVVAGAPNRMEAYRLALEEEAARRGLSYPELIADNLIGLDNEYQSYGETLGQQINADELGFLKNAGIAAYQGAKEAVLNPIDTVVGLATELYDAGAGLTTQDLNDRLLEMYGVGYDQATDEEINRARESVLGDAMTVASVVPVAKPLERAARAASDAVDAAQLAQYARFRAENMRPEFSPAGAANQRFYYPSREERFQMENTPTETQKIYLQQEAEADRLLREGADPLAVARQTGMIPVPLRTPDGRDEGYRLVASLNPEDWTAYRPRSNLNVDIEEVLFPRDIRKTVTGMVAPSDFEGATDRDFTVSLNSEMPKSLYPRILIHEGEHLDMFESDISAPEVGSNAPEAFNDKRALLRTMDDQIRAATDEAQRAELMRRRDALAGMTSMELYYNNPGEMLARLSEGNTESAKRLSPSEAFNPYLSNRGLARRGLDALLTSVFSELAPVGGALRRTLGPRVTPLPPFIRNVPTTFDRYVSVPMDMNRALITDPKYVPSNPAGVVRPNEAPDTFDYDPMAIIDPFDEPLAQPRTVIRPDDTYRGEGFVNSVPEGNFAVRVTGESQIEDMIRSGLVRPPEGGFPGTGKGTVYFHGMENARPSSVLHTPKDDSRKNYSIVVRGDVARSKGEPLTLDDLQNIWTLRDGEMVDVLEEIRRKNQDFGSQNFADGGVVAGAPNRMAAYQMATRPAAPVTSILDYDPEQFVAALDELGVTGEERAALEQQYFARNRALPMTERPENMRIGTVAPIAFPEGMTGAEALMSGNFEFTTPELVRGLYEVPAEAFNVVNAMLNGVPVTQQQMQESATGVAETITGIGPARAGVRAARGIESLQPNVVSMSGVRGVGDNGGPALEQFDENGFLRLDDIPAGPPRRFIHPDTGLYSPSFEAAKNLPQEVGTPQQMRAALLNSGAKEEELIYSGFDDWLRGKERVTKQEIEDVLGEAAAGQSGNMPYMRVSEQATAGVTGVQGMTFGELRNQLAADLRRQAIDERNAQMGSELQGRGYRPIRFADENEYRQMADQVRALYNNPESRGGLGPNGERLPPARVMNTITQIDSMMRRQGRSFEDREVQRILNSLADDNDYVIGPSGLPEFTDEVVRRELPDFAQNPYYGSLPMRTLEEISDRVNALSQQEVADQLGVSVDEMLANFEPGWSQYGSYVVPGMRNYSENQYMFDDTGRGVLSGIERLGVGSFYQRHFNADKKPLMFFTLTGELNTPEGPAYNLAQIQSDIGQAYNDAPDRFFVPGSTPTTLEIPKPQKAALRSYVDRAKEVADLERQVGEKLDILYDNYLSPETGALMKDAPGYREASDEIISLRQAAMQTRDELVQFETDNDDLFRKIGDFYGGVRTFSDTMGFGGDVTTERFEDILYGTANPKSGYGLVNKTASLPFATSTNRWLDAAFKSELVNAAKAGAEWITIPKGDDVQRYTGGDVAGQRKFYGGPDDKGIAPMRLKNLAKKLIPFETEFKDFEATGFGPRAPTYKVFGMRLTPEIREYILENGLPSFAKGGPVDGSSLDVDVFALG